MPNAFLFSLTGWTNAEAQDQADFTPVWDFKTEPETAMEMIDLSQR